jgi:hypothetical protein
MEFARLHLGLVLVIVGVAGEGIEIVWKLLVRKRSEKLDLALDSIGAFFWIILIVGLALEIPDAARTDKEAAESNKLAGQANERASTNELAAKQLEIQLGETKIELANAETHLIQIKNAIPPRQIPEKQKELFIATLLDTNILSPKIDIKVFVQDVDDPEAKKFADSFRKMLNDAGYGTNREEVIKIKPINTVPNASEKSARMPQLFVIYATDYDGKKIPLSMPSFGGCITIFLPTKNSVQSEIGNPRIPIANYYSTNPNDILGGICNILSYIGFPPTELISPGLLKPSEVAFYIPPQVQ